MNSRISFIRTILIQAIALLGVSLIAIVPVIASVEGMLISSDSSTLKIYGQPNREQPAIASGNVGDEVIILEQAYNNQGNIWDRVRLVIDPQIEGWIADSYVAQEQKQNVYDDPYDPHNYYQLNQFQYDNQYSQFNNQN